MGGLNWKRAKVKSQKVKGSEGGESVEAVVGAEGPCAEEGFAWMAVGRCDLDGDGG